ncbi:unnamed protein product [Caenorhabditis auriculariae]|uniref:Uncharacterized protein n=1 Tax=Caenorhabditis auriculariae TaxID=2777116 RepID=A0A8S1H5F2_9PELO|nr:unnamed protein product [Caenorhabditis auriculariae]
MQVRNEDITMAWGQTPHQLDSQYGRWRMAVFQDVQESVDMNRLYFLYDPELDERSGTSGSRKGGKCLVTFDTNIRCFTSEIPLYVPGELKFLFSLKCPSPQGGSALLLVTAEMMNQDLKLHVFRLDMSSDGMTISNLRPLLNEPLIIGGEFICCMRDDAPEIVVMANPGLKLWRIDGMAENPRPYVAYNDIYGAQLEHFYDGFLSNGNIVFLSASPDGHFDPSRVHLLNLNNPKNMTTQNTSADNARGMPTPRKQAGFDSAGNAILMAGGEIDRGYGNVERLTDYWVLDTHTFRWTQVMSQMPCPLIEPRLTVANSGNIYVWGDFDQPLPGMSHGTHLRIIRVTGFDQANKPPSYTPTAAPPPPAYPSLSDNSSPNPQNYQGYPQSQQQPLPPYPSYNPNQSNPGYGNQSAPQPYGGQYPGQNQYQGQGQQYPGQDQYGGQSNTMYPSGGSTDQYPGQHAVYPPQKNKKDCSIQ